MLSKVIITWVLGDIYIWKYIFYPLPTFFVLNTFSFLHFWNAPLEEALGSWSPPGAKGLHVLFRVTFIIKFEKEVCLPSVWIHKPKCERCDRDSRMQGERERERDREKRQQRGIFLSLPRQNCLRCLCVNLATVDVSEHRPRLLLGVETVFSVPMRRVYRYYVLTTSINHFCKLWNFLCRVESHRLPG